MQRFALLTGLCLMVMASLAYAGSPHFVGTCTSHTALDAEGQTVVTVDAKEAGLGDEAQIHATLTVEAECINPGGNHPKAANKETFGNVGTFPVQNGMASYSLSTTLAFSPNCSPPMSVKIDSVTLRDDTNNLTCKLSQ